jgi:UDP-3-O-[3-hydroxymyristoyl] glucosamine N-acyltransferase
MLLEPKPIASGIHCHGDRCATGARCANVGVGPYAVIGEDVHMRGTQIGAHCVIAAGCWDRGQLPVHPRVTFYSGVRVEIAWKFMRDAVIGADGFGYARARGAMEISADRTGGDRWRRGDRCERDDRSRVVDDTRIAEG